MLRRSRPSTQMPFPLPSLVRVPWCLSAQLASCQGQPRLPMATPQVSVPKFAESTCLPPLISRRNVWPGHQGLCWGAKEYIQDRARGRNNPPSFLMGKVVTPASWHPGFCRNMEPITWLPAPDLTRGDGPISPGSRRAGESGLRGGARRCEVHECKGPSGPRRVSKEPASQPESGPANG